jgi:hypothetical protein
VLTPPNVIDRTPHAQNWYFTSKLMLVGFPQNPVVDLIAIFRQQSTIAEFHSESELCLFGLGPTFAKEDAAFRSTHLAVKNFQEYAFDGSFFSVGHVSPPTQNACYT